MPDSTSTVITTSGPLAVPGTLHHMVSDAFERPVVHLTPCVCPVCLGELDRTPIRETASHIAGYFQGAGLIWGDKFEHMPAESFTPPIRSQAVAPEKASAEDVALIRAERDQLAEQLEQLRHNIGQVAVHYATEQGWSHYADEAERLVRHVGGYWPELQRLRFEVTATFEVEADYFGLALPDPRTADEIVDLDELRDGLRLSGENDIDTARPWHNSEVLGLPHVTITNLHRIQQ